MTPRSTPPNPDGSNPPTARLHAARLTGDAPEGPDLLIVGLSPELLRQLLAAPLSGDAVRVATPDGEKPLTLLIYHETGTDGAFEAHLPVIAANILSGHFPAAPPAARKNPTPSERREP